MMVRLSVIVPVYDVERYLRQCLDSICCQTLADWECILIDDGSPDSSGRICDEYAVKDSRFVVVHQENAGVSAARNVGIGLARGEYLTFIDADDWVSENYLSGLLAETNEKQMALADVRCFDAARTVYFNDYLGKRYESLEPGVLYPHVKVRSYFSTPAGKLIPTDVCRRFVFDRQFDFGEDGLFMFSVEPYLPQGVKATVDVVYYRRCVPESLSRKKRGRRKIMSNQMKLLLEYWRIYLKDISLYSFNFFVLRNLAVLSHIIKK